MINKVHQSDWLNNNLPDGCADLIIADPPYFEEKRQFVGFDLDPKHVKTANDRIEIMQDARKQMDIFDGGA